MDLMTKIELAEIAYEQNMNTISVKLMEMFNIPRENIKYIYVEKTDTEGVIFRVGNDCICAFSGTESIVDLWQDLLVIPVDYIEGYLHSGFNRIIKLLYNDVNKAIKKLFPNKDLERIYAYGHSLGGSIAVGVADFIKIYHYPHVYSEIITWGCPNGWSKTARKGVEGRHDNIINYVNSYDVVTKLLGLTTGRPGKDIPLKGRIGHRFVQYLYNMKEMTDV